MFFTNCGNNNRKTHLIKPFFKQVNCLFFHVIEANDDSITTQIQWFVTEIGAKFAFNNNSK